MNPKFGIGYKNLHDATLQNVILLFANLQRCIYIINCSFSTAKIFFAIPAFLQKFKMSKIYDELV